MIFLAHNGILLILKHHLFTNAIEQVCWLHLYG